MKKLSYSEKLNKILMACVSQDETRRNLMGVCHYSKLKALISIDGHRALYNFSHYNDKLRDEIIDPKSMTVIDREFPKVETVYNPSKINYNTKIMSVTLTPHETRKKIGRNAESNRLFFYADGTTSWENKGESVFTLNSELIKPLCDGTTYEVSYINELTMIIFKLHPDKNDVMVVMPLKL